MKASQVDALERLYRRFVPPQQLITLELANTLCEITRDMGRRTSVVISRKGSIEYVIVGNSMEVEDLPPLNPTAPQGNRLSGLRMVECRLRGEVLDKTDFHRLSMLSLDYILAIDGTAGRFPIMGHGAWLVPVNPEGKFYETIGPKPLHTLDFNFQEHIADLEEQFSTTLPRPSKAQPTRAQNGPSWSSWTMAVTGIPSGKSRNCGNLP